MKRNLFVLFVLAVSMVVAGCDKSITGPSGDGQPELPKPPPDPATYVSFFDPINLSEDEWALTLKFNSFTPSPGSTIWPVPSPSPFGNPCPQYCIYYTAVLSLAKMPPDNPTCNNCFTWRADVALYLSPDGVKKGNHIKSIGLGQMSNWSLETAFGNEGTNFQIPLFEVPTSIIIQWNYNFSTGNGTGITRSGTKVSRTSYVMG